MFDHHNSDSSLSSRVASQVGKETVAVCPSAATRVILSEAHVLFPVVANAPWDIQELIAKLVLVLRLFS
jgi:hypothetical protein